MRRPSSAQSRPALKLAAIGFFGILLAACGGGGASAGSAPVSCTAGTPFTGDLHAPLPAATFPTSAATSTAVLPAELAAKLDAHIGALLAQTGAPAIAAAIEVPGLGRWASTQGLARVQPQQPALATTPFYWASVTKSLTAVLALQLVEEGRLKLDDRLARWYPQMPQADLITIEQLLTHTSGLATNWAGATPLDSVTRAEQLAAAAATPLVFCPGSGVSYSNTGYWLLSLIVEAVTGEPYDVALRHRVAEPLEVLQLQALPPQQPAPDGFATPHLGRLPSSDPGLGSRLGAGSVFATPADMLRFWQALLSGRLLSPATVQRQWATLYRLRDAAAPELRWWAGQGVMLAEWTDVQGRNRPWLFHAGGDAVLGANAVLIYNPVVGAYVAVAVNSTVPSAAVATSLLEIVASWRAAH